MPGESPQGMLCERPGVTSVYFRPRTLEEATQALAEGGQALAGGTDFFPALGDRPSVGAIVDLSALADLRGISHEADCVRIGGATTWTEIVAAPLPRCFDALKAAAREIGGIQIQNRGTIAGNLCNASPAADSVPPLLILDAQVELVSVAGRRCLPLADFIVGNRKTRRRADEILASVIVPPRVDDSPSVFLKLGSRRYLVISIAMVAALLTHDGNSCVHDARVAVGACSVTAQRLSRLEQALVGKPMRQGIGSNAIPSHLAFLSPIDDVRATAEYRRDAALTLVRRAQEQCVRGLA